MRRGTHSAHPREHGYRRRDGSGGCRSRPGAASYQAWGSTGVLDAVSACVALRPPTLCFPVSSLVTLAPLAAGAGLPSSAAATPADGEADFGGTPPPLRDGLQMRPLSTIGDVFSACKRLGLCSGDYVRAEGKSVAAANAGAASAAGSSEAKTTATPLKKDDVLTASSAIVRLQSTRKSQWQS